MCTRFYIESDLQEILKPVQVSSLTLFMQEVFDKRVTISGEVRPTDMAAVIASNKRGVRGVFPMIWGFTASHPATPSNTSSYKANEGNSIVSARKKRPVPIVNCRVETAATKDLWRDSWFHHRCIIPASYYFEWGASINPADVSSGPASPGPLLDTLHPTDGRIIIGSNLDRSVSSSGRSVSDPDRLATVGTRTSTVDNSISSVDNSISTVNERETSVSMKAGSVSMKAVNKKDSSLKRKTQKTQKTQKTKYAIQPENELITYLAGLYRMENGYPHFAVLTREPRESIRFIHNRMPVILRADQVDAWIHPEAKPEEIVQEAIMEMEYMEIFS